MPMRKTHYRPKSELEELNITQPYCGVHRNWTCILTDNLDDVTCRNCLYRVAFELSSRSYQESQAMYERARTI